MTRSIVLLVFVFTVALVDSATAMQAEDKMFEYSCVDFDHKQNQIVAKGRISREQFVQWFKKDYGVKGERVETPAHATAFGVLVLTDGVETLVMPLYTWELKKQNYFACQSHRIGRAPRFRVFEKSRKLFFDQMKLEFAKLSKTKPVANHKGGMVQVLRYNPGIIEKKNWEISQRGRLSHPGGISQS